MKLYDVASTSPSFPTVQLILTALVTVLNGGFHFGFHISIVNPMATVLQDFLLEGFSRYSKKSSKQFFLVNTILNFLIKLLKYYGLLWLVKYSLGHYLEPLM